MDPLLRRSLYQLLLIVSTAAVCGRIMNVERVYEPSLHRPDGDTASTLSRWPDKRPSPSPTLGGNDRSRWATIRALVDEGTYAIGKREIDPATKSYKDTGIIKEDGWGTLDMVLHPDRNEFYSSKPPLLPTMLAGEYWLLKRLFGWTLTANTTAVVRTVLVTVNVLPFVLYLVLLGRLIDRFGTTDWGRLYVFVAACFGNYLTTFAVTLNNHSIGSWAVLIALYGGVRLWLKDGDSAWTWIWTGLSAGFAVCNELPSAAFAAALGVILLLRNPRAALGLYLPAVAAPLLVQVCLTYVALGIWEPAYAKVDSVWYKYEGSYWTPTEGKMNGIDWAHRKENRFQYALHLLLGHHGLFSLTPIFLITIAGLWFSIRRQSEDEPDRTRTMLTWITIFLSVVVIGFYLIKSDNYGGRTSGLRWLFWLTPFWLLTMLPAVDWLGQRRWGRGLALSLLAITVFSVNYPAWNPWRHPWLYNFMEGWGWIQY